MEPFAREALHAIRKLVRRPGFAVLAVVPLALAIGANATLFAVLDALLWGTIPGAQADQLRRVVVLTPGGGQRGRLSYPDLQSYGEAGAAAGALDGIAGLAMVPVTLGDGDGAEPLLGEVVSASFFDVLGITPTLGRAFVADADLPGRDRAAVISHTLWTQRFAANPDVLGHAVTLNGDPYTIVGVAPEGFRGTFAGAAVDVWAPLGTAGPWLGADWREDRESSLLRPLVRLAPGTNAQSADAALDAAAASLAQSFPDSKIIGVALNPPTLLDGGLRRGVSIFFAATGAMVALILLLAAADVAHLLLARALGERRDVALRLALGAGRWPIARRVLAENLVLGLLAGALGLLLAAWSADLLSAWSPISFVPLHLDVTPDARVFAFTLAVALAVGLLLSLAPALWATRCDPAAALGSGGRGATRPGARGWRRAFLVSQIAASFALVVAAALVFSSLRNVHRMDPGFSIERAVALDLDLDLAGKSPEAGQRYLDLLAQRLTALPGIEDATFADLAPLDLATRRGEIDIPGLSPPPGQERWRISLSRIAPTYFQTLGIDLAAGRPLDIRDTSDSRQVAVVNATFVRRFWPGQSALGKTFQRPDGTQVEVVGVARDIKYRSFGEAATAHLYLPLAQSPDPSVSILARTTGDPRPALAEIQREMARVDPDVRAFFARTLEEHVAFARLPSRLAAVLFGLFGALALVLATVGVYGAVAFAVAGRTHELGIRMALGASAAGVVRLVLRESLVELALGTLAGCVLAAVLGQLLGGLLVGVKATSLAAWPLGFVTVGSAVLFASWLPARRAVRLDPLRNLRAE